MSSMKDRFKDRLKDKLSQHEVATKIDNSLNDVLNFHLINNLCEDEKITKELKDSSIKIFNIQSKAVIELGEIFFNVYNLLSKSGSKDGIYTKWLEITGVSPRTALNYRKRYDIYNQVNLVGKNLVKKLPQKLIDEIFSKEDKKQFLDSLNRGDSKEILENIVNDERKFIDIDVQGKVEYFPEIKINRYLEVFNTLPTKYSNLNEEKKKELEKYLKKIEKILK